MKDPDFRDRERFAKAVQLVFETGRHFLFDILLLRKGSIEAITITLRIIQWEKHLQKHVKICLLGSGRQLSVNDFDITMIYAVIKKGHILGHKEVPTKGFGIEPEPSALSLGDDIERLRILRNKLCHSPFACMTQREFDVMKKDVKDIMHRWSNETGMGFLDRVDKVVDTSLSNTEVINIVDKFIKDVKQASAQGACTTSVMHIRNMVSIS